MAATNEKKKFNPISYVVIYEGMKYRYALHSTKKDKILFPSQILNILEYCLFKKFKTGDLNELNDETFKFDVVKMYAGTEVKEEKWTSKNVFVNCIKMALDEYFTNLSNDKEFFIDNANNE